MKLKLIDETIVRKIYEGYGYKITVRNIKRLLYADTDDEVKPTITVKGLKSNPLFYPDIMVVVPNVEDSIMEFSRLVSFGIDDFTYNMVLKGIEDSRNLVLEIKENYDEIVTFKKDPD